MADERVRDVQNWLNNTYGSNANWVQVDVDGQTGFYTVKALIRALQIELGLEVDGTFGNGTKNGFNTRFPNGLSKSTDATEQSTKNIIAIVNGGFWCRGIEGERNDRYVFGDYTEAGVILMKSQLGILQPTGEIKAREMKAILTTDAYTLTSNGDANVREIQQQINRKYIDVFGSYIATNGIYERNMNTAIIKAIQHEIVVEVDGGWGEGTKSALPVLGPGSSRTNLVYILQYLLYLNGFNPNGFDGGFGNGVTTALKAFQTLMKLDVDGYCGRQAWSALVVSCGDTARSANACDTRFEITTERARFLKNNGYEIVGRYITGGEFKELREGELDVIFEEGLKVFFIFQDNNRQLSDFSYPKGIQAASKANGGARKHNLKEDTVIYFAVDFDVYEEDIDEHIIEFFKGINDYIDTRYKVGIYGPREVCRRVANAGLSVSSFVSDMSYGYSCNIGKKIPDDWCYDQFKTINKIYGDMDLDIVTFSGRIQPASAKAEEDTSNPNNINREVFDFIERIYDEVKDVKGNISIRDTNMAVLQYLAYLTYDNWGWKQLIEYDEVLIQYLKGRLITKGDERNLLIFSKDYNTYITLPHLAVSTLMLMKTQHNSIGAVINDLCSWAGDLLTFAGNFEAGYNNGKYGNEDCTIEKITEIIADDDSLSFGREDLIQDIDAWNIYAFLDEYPIHEVLKTYYNVSQTGRITKFIAKRVSFGYLPETINSNDSNSAILYKLAKFYLEQDSSLAIEALIGVFQAINPPEFTMVDELADTIAQAFANKLTSLI